MNAAIYARKSTEQRGSAETKSITRQVADARAFAQQRGLAPIEDRFVYCDDAVSGADVKHLHGRARLIADIDAVPITTVIMADMSRFSRREGHEVVAELRQIARKAEVWFFETGARYTFGDIGCNIANFAVAESNADYRRKVRVKTVASMKRKAELGHVLGGHCFGYRNVDVLTGQTDASGRPVRSHVTRQIHLEEAIVVRDIFDCYARGLGLKKIADALNRQGAPTPRPRLGRPASWVASSVRSTLLQPLYRGTVRWNRLRQHDEDGNPVFVVNPKAEHVQCFNEAWRIVPAAVSSIVDARFADDTRKKFGPQVGRRTASKVNGSSVSSSLRTIQTPGSEGARLRWLEMQGPAFVDHIVTLAYGQPNGGRRQFRQDVTGALERLLAAAAAVR